MSLYDRVRTQKILSFSLILFTLAIGVLIGTVVQTGAKAARDQQAAPDATPLTVPSPVQVENEFTKIAKRLEPSVVNISTEYIPKTEPSSQNRVNPRRRQQIQPQVPQDEDQPDSQGQDNGGMQQFLQRFFGQGGGGGGFQFGEPQEEGRSAATGSGVVVDPNGYILTNNHVIDKATRIKVKFMNDQTEYPARLIGTDKDTDLAVIHVDRRNLPAAKIGNSDALQVGDWAMAIGSPFGFEATVTAGIVSALARDIGDGSATTFQHFIQTDAAINPGNSGGPLLNIKGEVIGINTMIASRSGGYQGIGFAMPINTAAKVYNDIIHEGHVTRGSIGIQFDARDNPDLLKVYGANHGLFVTKIEGDGPAEKAGLKVQDIITEINGKPLHKGQDLIDIVADSPVGSTVKVAIVRDKKPMAMNVVVGDRAKVFASLYGGKAPAEKSDGSSEALQVRFGMTIQPLNSTQKQRLAYKGDGSVQVSSVEPASFAEDIGLAKGDILIEMNRQAVNSPEDIKKLQGNLKPGDSVAFHLMRQTQGARGTGDWQSLFVYGKVPESNQ